MFRRNGMMFLVLLFALAIPLSGAFAQGGSTVFCGDLSDADCDILVQSEAAMQTLESSTFNLAVDFSLTGDPEAMGGMEGFAFAMDVAGAGAADMDMLGDFQQMTPEDLPQIMENLPVMLGEVLRAITGEATLTVELPVELMAAAGSPDLDSLVLELLMADGVLYINLDTLAPLMSESGEAGMSGWMGLDLAGMYEVMFEQMGDEMGAQMEDQMGAMQDLFDTDFFNMMSNPEMLNGFMNIERLDDVEHMGQTMAVFQTTLDYEAMLNTEAFQAGFQEYMQAVMEMQAGMTGELPEGFDTTMSEAAMQMMSGISLTMVQWVGQEDFYTHHIDVAMDFDMDFAALAEMLPDEADEMPDNFVMSMDFVLDLGAFNEPVEVTVPEGAPVINPMMMVPGAMSG